MDDLGDDKEGWIGVVGASDGPWRRWAVAAWCEVIPMENPEFGKRVACRAKSVAFSWDMVKWGKRWGISLAS